MNTTDIDTEVVYRIHFDRVYLEVGTYPDNPDWVHLRTPDQDSKGYFGPIDLTIPPAVAKALGEALQLQAQRMAAKE